MIPLVIAQGNFIIASVYTQLETLSNEAETNLLLFVVVIVVVKNETDILTKPVLFEPLGH